MSEISCWAPDHTVVRACRATAPQSAHAAATLELEVQLLKLNADIAPATCTPSGRGYPREVPSASR
jgi:hypothetical protein